MLNLGSLRQGFWKGRGMTRGPVRGTSEDSPLTIKYPFGRLALNGARSFLSKLNFPQENRWRAELLMRYLGTAKPRCKSQQNLSIINLLKQNQSKFDEMVDGVPLLMAVHS